MKTPEGISLILSPDRNLKNINQDNFTTFFTLKSEKAAFRTTQEKACSSYYIYGNCDMLSLDHALVKPLNETALFTALAPTSTVFLKV